VPYLLDGNNLIGLARRTARPSEEDRAALIRELCDRLRRTKARAVLYFDGTAPGGGSELGDLRIRFSGSVSADDAIVREISRAPAPGEIVLVTADRGLARRARDAGARTLDPGAFWKRFGGGSTESAREDSPGVDVEDWLRYFENEKNRG
jgi:hypothetical protein